MTDDPKPGTPMPDEAGTDTAQESGAGYGNNAGESGDSGAAGGMGGDVENPEPGRDKR